jgi:predicted transcriptional regulator YheO
MKSSAKCLLKFFPLVDAIAGTFGKNCEVVLHDLSHPENSIIKIANGHVTGRKVGGPVTDLALSSFMKNNLKNDSLVGYKSRTKKGNELKSTTIFIRDEKQKIVGAMCINIDISPYISAQKILDEFCKISTEFKGSDLNLKSEKFESSVENLIENLIEQAKEKIDKPLSHMGKEDKLQIMRNLKENGLFLIKGSAKKVSKELNVSLATVYKYLEEIH